MRKVKSKISQDTVAGAGGSALLSELNKAVETIKMLQEQNRQYAEKFRERSEQGDPQGDREELVSNLQSLEQRVGSLQEDYLGPAQPPKPRQSADDVTTRRQRPKPIQVLNSHVPKRSGNEF